MHEAHPKRPARELPRPSAKGVSGTRCCAEAPRTKRRRSKEAWEEEAAAKKLDARKPAWLCSGDQSQCGALNVRVYHTDALEMTPEQRVDYERQYPHGIPVNHPSLLIGSPGEECGLGGADRSRKCFYTKKDQLYVAPGTYEVAVVEGFPRPYWIDTGTTRERAFGTHVYDSRDRDGERRTDSGSNAHDLRQVEFVHGRRENLPGKRGRPPLPDLAAPSQAELYFGGQRPLGVGGHGGR